MPTFSKAQQEAIYTQNKNIIVSASAGSGKTTVLIARLLNLIQNEKVDIKNILAMTFTEAAASEMKKRLSASLNDAINNSKDNEEILYLQKQLANISNAYISTIHGFCLTIIKNYYYVIGLNKDRINNVMDESTKAFIIDKSMKHTFDTYIESEHFLALCQFFSSKANSDDNLKTAILDLFNLANAKSDPISFLKSCIINKEYATFNDYPEIIQSYFFDYLKVSTATISSLVKDYLLIALSDPNFSNTNEIEEKRNLFTDSIKSLSLNDYVDFKNKFLFACGKVLPAIKDHEPSKKLKKQIETLEVDMQAILFDEKTYVSFSNQNRMIVNTLVEVTIYFYETYNRYKAALNCIDFSDMEHYALAILKAQNGLVASFYRDLFVEIMVDEFQDSNDVQDTLVKLICKENNVFRVGDIKQSIYGFRHATPEIMRSLMNDKNINNKIIYLSNNYRSKKTVVDFNNQLYDTLMNIKGFNSSFTSHDYTTCGSSQQKKEGKPVCFHKLDNTYFKEYSKEYYVSTDSLKADYVAYQINKMVKEGRKYRDFVVLIKTNAKAAFLREAFEQAKIPYFISMKQGFFETNAISKITVFLKALLNPYDDLNFCAFLLSDFYNLSNDDLIEAKLSKPNSYYEYFNSKIDLSKFNRILETVKTTKISDLLQEIYNFNAYYELCTSLQEKSNLDKLYELALSYETKQFTTLKQFLSIIEQSKEATVGEAIPIGNEDNVVRVMTIHQSKGLQFPVVFLYSTGSTTIHDTTGIIAIDDELKIALNHMDPSYRYTCESLEHIALNHKIKKATLEEEMRLLYVATTRAQEELHIVDYGNNEEVNELSLVEIYKCNGFTSWILQSMAYKSKKHLYYNEIYVDSLWEQTASSINKQNTNYTFTYKHTYDEISTHSPSENEILSYKPNPFSLKENYGLDRGTTLHKMVQLLPNCIWDETLIKNTMNKHELILSKHDIDVLLSLNSNSIFIETFKGKVIHECPFIIKENNTITHGFMDFISIFDDKVYMIDFKSDRNVDSSILISRYKGQIDAYTNALKLIYPDKTILSYIYSFELKEMITM